MFNFLSLLSFDPRFDIQMLITNYEISKVMDKRGVT
jgi:hypothetical protein